MKKMKNKFAFIKLSVRVLKGKNMVSRILVLCIVILTVLPMVLQGISQGLMEEVAESKKNVYGEFTDILYLDHEKFDHIEGIIKQSRDEINFEIAGVMYTVFTEKWENTSVHAGYVDENAVKLGRIKLAWGTFPEKRNEIAVTESLMEKLEAKSRETGEIEIGDDTYKIVGLIEDYGRLWPRREKEIQEGIGAVNVFFSKEGIQEGEWDEDSSVLQLLLLRNSDELITVKRGEIIANINNQIRVSESVFRLPKGLLAMLYLCETIIFFNVLLLSYGKTFSRCRIYMQLGMNESHIFLCLMSELSVTLAAGLLGGVLIGTGAIAGILSLLGKRLSTKLPLNGAGHMVFYGLLFGIIAFFCSLFFACKILRDLKSRNGSGNHKNRGKIRRYTFARLMFGEFRREKGVWALLLLLLVTCSSFLGFTIAYKNYFSAEVSYKQYKGKMPFDYDIEFSTMVRESDVTMENGMYFDDTYERDGAPEEVISRIKEEKGIDKVCLYKENNKVKVLLGEDQMDRYLDASDFFDDGRYSPVGREGRIQEVFDYENHILANAKVVGYNVEELLSFGQYVVEGDIDMDRLAAGEEVILVAPPYTLTKQEDGGIRKDWCEYETPGAYENTVLHAGDEITLTYLESEHPYNGTVDKETLLDSYSRKDKKVIIGAVLGTFVGWFENEATLGETYYIYTTHDAFENLGMDVTYNRFRIYTEPGAEYDQTAEIIKNYSSELPYMQVQDLRKELETYRNLRLLIEIFCCVLISLAMMAVTFCIASQLLFKTRLNLRKYMLLRINGLSLRKLSGMILIQVILLGVTGIVLAALPTVWLAKTALHLNAYGVKKYLMTAELFRLGFCAVPFLVIAALPALATLHRTKIKDVL